MAMNLLCALRHLAIRVVIQFSPKPAGLRVVVARPFQEIERSCNMILPMPLRRCRPWRSRKAMVGRAPAVRVRGLYRRAQVVAAPRKQMLSNPDTFPSDSRNGYHRSSKTSDANGFTPA